MRPISLPSGPLPPEGHDPAPDWAAAAAVAAARALRADVRAVEPIAGRGVVNRVFIVRTPAAAVVVRLSERDGALREYRKERWCLRRAAEQGVPGPRVLALGSAAGRAHMVETLVPGQAAADSGIDPLYLWRRIGECARRIHAVPARGFGETLADARHGVFAAPPHPGFDGSWASFVTYNIDSLTADDPLLGLGVLTAGQVPRLRRVLERVRAHPYRFGLIHGDLSLPNALVDGAGEVALLDWGSAAAHVVPAAELAVVREACGGGRAGAARLEAFHAGYGLTRAAAAQLRPEVDRLLLLSVLDKCRWALDRAPEAVPAYAARARDVVSSVLPAL